MTAELLKGEGCRWCGRDLSKSFLSEVAGGIEKEDSMLFPILCICGGITVIGAGTFISHFDEVSGSKKPEAGGKLNKQKKGVVGKTTPTEAQCRNQNI